ncbi:MAG: roadblock/LC7 domain-containing protein [Myxococcota bacterium]
MSNNINNVLNQLTSLDGFVGVGLVNAESGMLLGRTGGGNIDLAIAAAVNTEVVRAKRKAIKRLKLEDDIEDILITLTQQYHLIRLSKLRPKLFFYLVLDRERSNLALARMELEEVEQQLEL